MHRREFIQMTMGLALAAEAARGAQFPGAQEAAPAPHVPPAHPLKIDAYSRHLQWLRTPDEVAQACIDMGFTGLDITVRPYPGHVDPTKVAQDLPPFVNAIRKHGIDVDMITAPITDADSPNAEEILATASSLGITRYWWGTFHYDTTQPVMEQLDALKPRVEKLVALNQKYKMKAMYHTYEGDRMVGAAIWDLLYVLKNFDPQYVSFHYDVGHMVVAGGGNTWALNLRAAGPYIGGVSAKDYVIKLDLDLSGGGPYAGQPLGGFFGAPGRGRGAAPGEGRGGEAPGAAPAGAPSGGQAPEGPGRAANAPEGAAAGGRGAPESAAGPEAGGRGAGRGGRGGFPGAGGRGSQPSRGGGGAPNDYRVTPVPLGDGLANLDELGQILKEINFSGPVEIQAEYPNGGAENGLDKITLPREMVLGAMKRDRLVLKAAFEQDDLM